MQPTACQLRVLQLVRQGMGRRKIMNLLGRHNITIAQHLKHCAQRGWLARMADPKCSLGRYALTFAGAMTLNQCERTNPQLTHDLLALLESSV